MNEYIAKFNNYLSNKKKLSNNTASAYISDLESFEAYVLDSYKKDMLNVTKTMILTYMLNMQKKSKNASTVSRNLSSIKSFYRFLDEEGIISKNPSINIHAPKIEKKLPSFLDISEIEKFLNAPDTSTRKGARDKAMLELMYSSGIKVTELLILELDDYNKNTDSIALRSSNNTRHVPVGSHAKKYLTIYLEEHRQFMLENSSEKLIFVNINGTGMSRQGFWKIVNYYTKKAGINKKITPQIIRNSFIIHLLQNGADINTLQSLFDQNSISAVQMYLKSQEKRTFDSYKKFHPRA
jgi:integrase/recombinase XerD